MAEFLEPPETVPPAREAYAPLAMRPPEAARYVGGERNLLVLKAFFGLRPTVAHKRNTTYSRARLEAAFRRADAEGWPDPDEIREKLGK